MHILCCIEYSTLSGGARDVPVKLIEGVDHMEIVSAPAAVSAIADDVARAGSGS